MSETDHDRYPNLRERRAALRQHATPAEKLLWNELRGRRFDARKFRRQQQLGPYIVDFYRSHAALVVDLDGFQHQMPAGVEYDEARTAFLSGRGLRVLRFTNSEVLTNLEGVLEIISVAVESPPSP
jgi:very-short-patch-repair endonuclease